MGFLFEPVTTQPTLPPPPANQNAAATAADNDNRPTFLAAGYNGTLASLIGRYLTDPVSPFHVTRHCTKMSNRVLCRRLTAEHGTARITDLKYRGFLEWKTTWQLQSADVS